MVKQALEALTPEMKELAEENDLNYGTLRAWRAGIRSPSDENVERIANMIEEHGVKLMRHAARLRVKGSSDGEGDR